MGALRYLEPVRTAVRDVEFTATIPSTQSLAPDRQLAGQATRESEIAPHFDMFVVCREKIGEGKCVNDTEGSALSSKE